MNLTTNDNQKPVFDKETMADTLLKWSNVNTGTFNTEGVEKFSNILLEAFNELSCEAEKIKLDPLELYNDQGVIEKKDLGSLLSFSKRKEAPLQVLLVGHMDTVFPANDLFQTAFRKNAEVLVGPGVTDMKGGILILLEALKAFEKSGEFKSQLGWQVIINPDEEIGSIASGPFLAEKAKICHLGLLFEPAMDELGTIASDRKGSGRFTLIVRGRAAHAGRDFHLGKNAIVTLAEMIQKIDQLNGQRKDVTINVGNITGGGSINIVPALSIARLDVRIKEIEDENWVLNHLHSIVEKAKEKEGFTIELHGGFHRRPKKVHGKTLALYELLALIGKENGFNITWSPSGGCCDGNNLSEVGLPNIDSLGVCGGKIHSNEEYCLVNSLASRTFLTYSLLRYLAKNGF